MDAAAAPPATATPRASVVGRSRDEAALRDLYDRMMAAWNHGSGTAFAAAFAEDGHLVGFDGTHFRGRAEVAPFHQELFDKWLKGTRLVGRVTDIRFLSPDVALLHAVGGTIARGKSTPAPDRDSIQTFVATREDDGWHLAAFQNTRLRPIGPGLGSILAWLVTDLLWKLLRWNRGVMRNA
jgi:uncharacterized protein (TIGR02246 family)